jgi:hypothetical protein
LLPPLKIAELIVLKVLSENKASTFSFTTSLTLRERSICSKPAGPRELFCGFTNVYGDRFGGTKIYADAALCALHYIDDLGFSVLAFFESTLWTNSYADLPSARRAFSIVDGDR